jgi:hypothetical protein
LNLQVVAPTLESAVTAVAEGHPKVAFIKVMRDRFIHDLIVVPEGEEGKAE